MADQAVTLATATSATNAKLLQPLSAEQTRQTGFTHRWRIPFDVLNTASWTTQGDTITVTLGATPAKFLVTRAMVDIRTAFATTGTLTVQVGTTADKGNFVDAQTAKTAAIIIGAAGALPVTEAGTVGIASVSLCATFTTQAATGAPADITAGSCDVYLAVIDTTSLN